MKLRPYQRATIDALYAWFQDHPTGHPLLILPCGAGKSVVLAAFIREVLQTWPGQRILMLTHVKELIQQNVEKLVAVWPLAPMGIYSAGLKRRDTSAPIIFAGIQSVWKKARHLGYFDLVFIDECHLVSARASGMYRAFLQELEHINPALRVIGLTATPFRTGTGDITHGEDALFEAVAHEVKLLDLVEQGYLAPLIPKRMVTALDVTEVTIRNGEYVASELETAVDQHEITVAALEEVLAYGATRTRWLVFCAGVRHAEHVCEALRERAISAGCVTGQTPARERDRLIAEYRAGQLRALTNANVLTTGFDVPQTDLLVMLRPTQSPGLYVQMCGRGMRLAEGKTDGLLLDFAGNVRRHGPVDQVQAWIPNVRPGEAPIKTCPECQTIVAASVRECPECGYEFPFDEKPKHASEAVDAPVLSNQMDPAESLNKTYPVTEVIYGRHEKPGKPPSLRVDYYSGLLHAASEWVCLEHTGYARTKAVRWWQRRARGGPLPSTVEKALQNVEVLAAPQTITVNTYGQYPEIVNYEFRNSSPIPPYPCPEGTPARPAA